MNVIFLEKFGKDSGAIRDEKIQKRIAAVIEKTENASKLSEIKNLKR